ncbi:MAG: glycosyltransferase [Phycisphaerae bacterium]|nr:glycosyltransferase [Tepidisphaeraceae bacterium]
MKSDAPINVLHLCAGNMYGGVERLLVTLARERGRCAGMRPTFAACFEGRLTSELRETGVDVAVLGAVKASRPWTGWAARRKLRKLIDAGGFDVVVAHACWPLVMLGGAARAAGKPIAMWAHDILKNDNWIETKAAKMPPDLVLANSRATAESVKRVFPTAGARWEYLPVAPAEVGDRAAVRSAIRAELGTSDDKVVIVCASRLERWKGHAVLVDALAKLKADARWECWIAGGAQRPEEEAYLAELKHSAERGGVGGRVKFLGQRTDVARVLAAADVHCQPNTGAEPFGIAFVEAMYASLPVVTSGIGGALELVNDACGVLVTPNAPDELAGELTKLIVDADRRAALGAGGVRRATELCEPGRVMGRIAGVLAGLARGASKGVAA